MIYATPGSLFESTVQGAATGLVGTIGVRIKALPANTTVFARTTAGIVETVTGIYAKQLTAPTTAGAYVIVWDDGTNFASEDLTVTYTLPVPAVPGDPIVSLSDYQAATGSTDHPDAQLAALLDASAACRTYTDRDFNTALTTETRDYTYRGQGFLEIDDAAAVTNVTSTFPIFRWFAHQDGPASANVFTWLELPKLDRSNSASAGAMGFTRNLDNFLRQGGGYPWEWTVSVTGTFGWPTVPRDVARGVIAQAQIFQRSGLSNSSGPISSETVAETSRSYVIPAPVQPSSAEDAGYSPAATALWWPFKRHVL